IPRFTDTSNVSWNLTLESSLRRATASSIGYNLATSTFSRIARARFDNLAITVPPLPVPLHGRSRQSFSPHHRDQQRSNPVLLPWRSPPVAPGSPCRPCRCWDAHCHL